MVKQLKSEAYIIILTCCVLILHLSITYADYIRNLWMIIFVCNILLTRYIKSKHNRKKVWILNFIFLIFVFNSRIYLTNNQSFDRDYDNGKSKEYVLELLSYKNDILDFGLSKFNRVKIISTIPHNENLVGRLATIYNSDNPNFKKSDSLIIGNVNECTNGISIKNIRDLQSKELFTKKGCENTENFLNNIIIYESVQFGWSMLTGSKIYLKDAIRSKFISTGTMHLFAVSGLHIGFFYLIISLIFKPIRISRIYLIVLKLSICSFFLHAIDSPYSGIRALLMISVFELSHLITRRYSNISSFCLAVLIMNFFNKEIIFSVSAQLSFTVVLFILFVIQDNSILKDNKVFSYKNIFLIFIISFSASAGSLILVLDHFDYFSFTSILVNVLITPFLFIFYSVNLLFFVSYFLFNSLILFVPQVMLYEIIYYIIDLGFFVTSIISSSKKFDFDLNDFTHFVVFIFLLFSFCFKIKPRFRFLIIFIYYSLFWGFCFWLS